MQSVEEREGIFSRVEKLPTRDRANPPSQERHLNFRDLVLRRLGCFASISSGRSEAVSSVLVWWRPSALLRPHRDPCRLRATRRVYTPITCHQPRRQILRRYVRARVFIPRHTQE